MMDKKTITLIVTSAVESAQPRCVLMAKGEVLGTWRLRSHLQETYRARRRINSTLFYYKTIQTKNFKHNEKN